MAEIAQRVFAADGTQSLLRLYREEFVRPVQVPSSWARLRLAISAAVTDTGGNLNSNGFFFGFCSGTTSTFTNANTIHAAGFEGSSSTMTRGGTTAPYYIFSGAAYYGTRRVNGVSSRSTAGIGSYDIVATGGIGSGRSAIIVDFIAATGDVNVILPRASVASVDMSADQFIQAVETMSPIWNGAASGLSSITTNPASSSTAPLDTVNIYWSNGLAPLEIYAIAVYAYST